MFPFCPTHLALVRLVRARFPTADFFPEGGPALVASVPSLGPEVRVVVRYERSFEGGNGFVILAGSVTGE